MNQNDTVATIKKAQSMAHSGPQQAYNKSAWGKTLPVGQVAKAASRLHGWKKNKK